MLKVGITGGIGSGKSIVCQVFSTLGIPVFNADTAAKYLMEHDAILKEHIKSLLGSDVFQNGTPDSAKIASIVFTDPAKLQQLNALVHPATIAFSKDWMASQQAPYCIKEAAIFFETGSDKDMDIMIGVFAPADLRIKRAMLRGNVTKQEVLNRMSQQMDEEEKMKRCNYVVTNDDTKALIPQVLSIHSILCA